LRAFTEDEFKAARVAFHANNAARKPRRSIESFLPDRRANSRYERETFANVARIISSARLILKATEFDASSTAEMLRSLAQATIDLWTFTSPPRPIDDNDDEP
jgi:hypothetical protein